MRVFVAGATGVLGRRIVGQLAARGHTAVGLVRSDAGDDAVRSLGGEARRGDLFDADSLARAAEGCDVVIRAATAIPTKVRTEPRDWVMNDRIRTEGTRNLTTAAARIGAKAFIQESVVWAVRGPDGTRFDEGAPPVADPVLASALEGERIVRDAGVAHGFPSAVLRCGSFYSADGWHTRMLGGALARRRPVLLSGANPIWSLIHADDAASAFVAASEAPRAGAWHVVDDRPAPVSEYLGLMAESLALQPPRRMPRWLARLVLGKYVAEFLSSSFETTNARFRQDFGWRPTYPTYVEGLRQVVAAWREEGFPPPRS